MANDGNRRTLNDAVKKAMAELNKAYAGIGIDFKGDVLVLDALIKQYQSDANLKSISKYFSDAANTISSMRSGYLPAELFPSMYDSEQEADSEGGIIRASSGGASISKRIGDNYTESESYENAFMRMLGMPMSDDDRFSENTLTWVKTNGDLIGPGDKFAKNMKSLELSILDERQKNNLYRKIKITDEIFKFGGSAAVLSYEWTEQDVDKTIEAHEKWVALANSTPQLSVEQLATQKDAILTGLGYDSDSKIKYVWDLLQSAPQIYDEFKELVESAKESGDVADQVKKFIKKYEEKITIYSLHEDFFSYKYLLLPPVQDGRISKCLNNPEKIVSSPFSGTSNIINEKSTQSSLLEAVIRIRFDKASGMSREHQEKLSSNPEYFPESYGLLEALIIARLRAAIGAYASNVRSSIEKLLKYQETIGVEISEHPARTSTTKLEDNRAANIVEAGVLSGSINEEFLSIDRKRTVEMAILTLFGNTEKVPGLSSFVETKDNILDSEVGNMRNSSVIDAHLIGPTLNIVGLPLVAINEKYNSKKKEMKKKKVDGNDAVSKIRTILGVTNGVGAIDIAVFSLALFSLPEIYLLGLLPKDRFEALQNIEEFRYLIAGVGGSQPDLSQSINALSYLIYEGYMLFVDQLRSFRYEEDLKKGRAPVENTDD